MKLALLATAVALMIGQQDSTTKTFTEQYLGIQFNYPKTWTIEKTTKPTLTTAPSKSKRKPRIDKSTTLFSIPIANSMQKAELEVVRTEYHASIDLWQTIQLRESELNRTQVVRQWEQDILGVPMLFCRIDSTTRGTQLTSIVGLFYTRTSLKLLLRMTAPSSQIDSVQYEFNKMLETLRYVDGTLPQEDDPSINLEPVAKKLQPVMATPKVIDAPPTGPKVPIKAPVATDLVVSTHKVVLRLPEGWSVANANGNTIELHSADVGSPVRLQAFSTLDSDPAGAALEKLAAKDLVDFGKVTSREDTASKVNAAGCSVAAVWRTGQANGGDLVTGEAYGSMGDLYFLIHYRQTDVSNYKAERKAIEQMLRQVSIEMAP
ncbi:MAG: hypothetical protein P4L46_23710 [Fimbriimonas sp.]|nr:hypothetical protein [Fimbriimonas sp.]